MGPSGGSAALALALFARTAAGPILHQALLPNGVNLPIADQLTKRLAQLVGQFIEAHANSSELVVGDALSELAAAKTVLTVAQQLLDGSFDGVLLGLIEPRAAGRLAGRGGWSAGLATQDGVGKVHDAHRRDDGPDIPVLLDAGDELLHADLIAGVELMEHRLRSLAAQVFMRAFSSCSNSELISRVLLIVEAGPFFAAIFAPLSCFAVARVFDSYSKKTAATCVARLF
jgi:hypothetical protein